MIILSCCLFAFAVTSYAAGGIERIQAYLNHDFKFTLNGQDWTPRNQEGNQLAPVILDGSSYLPVKAIVEVTGGKVTWNEATKTIEIVSSDKVQQKINEVKEKLKLGLTKDEAQALFKEEFEPADDKGDIENGSDSFSKYSFFKEAGYERSLPDHVPDEEGLLNKKVGAYLFIGWKENKLHFYSISYVNPSDNQVYLFIMRPDGTTGDSPVIPRM